MNQAQFWKNDIYLKGIGILCTLIGFVVAIWLYSANKRKEFYLSYWNNRADAYGEVCDAAGTIWAAGSYGERIEDVPHTARRTFWSVYYGKFAIYAEGDAQRKVREFAEFIETDTGFQKTPWPEATKAQLGERLLAASTACTKSLRDSWPGDFR